MIGRIVRPADFQRVLAAPLRSRSTHFAVHYLAEPPGSARADRQARLAFADVTAAQGPATPAGSELSTDLSTADGLCPLVADPMPAATVGNPPAAAPLPPLPGGHWLGLVVPKRHAKRAVTRNLIKRQVRALITSHLPELPPGLWVVRLRAPFERQVFVSPASDALRASAHAELATLIDRAIRSPLPPRPPRPRAEGSSRPSRR